MSNPFEQPTNPAETMSSDHRDTMSFGDFMTHRPDLDGKITQEQYYAAQTDEAFEELLDLADREKEQATHEPIARSGPSKQMSRRGFLKIAAGAGALAAGGFGAHHLLKESSEESQKSILEKIPQPTKERAKIENEDLEITARHFMEQVREHGRVDVAEAKKAIFHEYYEKYSPGTPEHRRSLEGLERQQPYLQEIHNAAVENNIPYTLNLALGIGESYLEDDAISHSGAVGSWQFMKRTAEVSMNNLGMPLTVSNTYDERRDPVLASRAASKLLNWNRDHFDGDLDVGITGYNGWTLAKRYERQCKKDGVSCSYNGYNTWLENAINARLTQARIEAETSSDTYDVRKGDTPSTIAKRLNISLEVLLKDNGLTEKSVIKIGQTLRLPKGSTSTQERFEQAAEKLFAAKWKENFIYPEKIRAIEKMLIDHEILAQFPPQSPIYDYDKSLEVTHHIIITAKKGDTLWGLAKGAKKQYNLTAEITEIVASLKSTNKLANDDIQPNQVLKLALKDVRVTPPLISIARTANIELTTLQTLNPAVKDINKPLPLHAQIRKPKDSRIIAHHQ